MEVKKNPPPKLVVKRKESAIPKPEPKPEPTPPTIDPTNIPKVKTETDTKTVSQFEQIKQKRDQMFQQEKIRQKMIKQNAITARKQMRIFQISLAITLIVLLIFAPVYPNKNFTAQNGNYLTYSELNIEHPLGDYFSPFQYSRFRSELRQSSEYIKSINVHYKLREQMVSVSFTEYKPLVKDNENNIYFYENDEVVKKSGLDLYAPVISGFDQDDLTKLLKNMQKLSYDVIMQIDTIEYVGTEDDPDLLKMGMDGDHTVYIDIDQIDDKLPYYNQIKQIIDEKADGKPGIIHLNIGDYYEPK